MTSFQHPAITRSLAIASFLLLSSAAAKAADVGFGVGVGSGIDILHLTVRFSGLRLEPYFGNYRIKTDSDDTSLGYPTSSKYSGQGGGVGVFASHRPADAVEVFAGGRIGYRREREQRASAVYAYESSSRTSGYELTPTAGFEYFFHRQVSIGAEVSYVFVRTRGHMQDSYGASFTTRERTQGTMSAITLRYYL